MNCKDRFPPKRLVLIFSSVFLAVSLASCDENIFEDTPNIFNPPNRYESCCDSVPLRVDTLGMHIFVPNAISPNADELNDHFSIYTNIPMRILTLHVQERNQVLEIRRSRINIEGHTPLWQPKNSSGKPVHGLFSYEMEVHNFKGDTLMLEGQFCALDCRDEKISEVDFPTCVFTSNTNVEGIVDTSSLYLENDCSF